MQKDRFTNRRMNDACEMEKWDEHAPSQTDEPIKPSNMQVRNNMLELHQEDQGPLKTSRSSPCGGEAMIHHEDIHHPATLKLDMHSSNNTDVQAFSCCVMS